MIDDKSSSLYIYPHSILGTDVQAVAVQTPPALLGRSLNLHDRVEPLPSLLPRISRLTQAPGEDGGGGGDGLPLLRTLQTRNADTEAQETSRT